MSSPSPETETHEIELGTDEQWIAHHAIVTRVDELIDEGDEPPTWAIDVFDALESAGETATLTGYQARRLRELLTDYLDRADAPDEDVEHGSNAIDRLESVLESPA